jgi:hydrogenase nickel incorporation protein HypB
VTTAPRVRGTPYSTAAVVTLARFPRRGRSFEALPYVAFASFGQREFAAGGRKSESGLFSRASVDRIFLDPRLLRMHELAVAERCISIEDSVLAKNDALAAENRHLFTSRGLAVFNLTSAPGSGKTTLIESLGVRLAGRIRIAVVEGDQETARDAERVRALGIPAVQVNTRNGCHLDAVMVRRAVDQLDPAGGSLLLIENVGNLVCPALIDLGERTKVVLMSVTEGEDKPLKYPHMFRAASVLLLSKIDLLPYLDFDVTACLAYARRVNPELRVFQISAKTGEGLPVLCEWLAAETERGST